MKQKAILVFIFFAQLLLGSCRDTSAIKNEISESGDNDINNISHNGSISRFITTVCLIIIFFMSLLGCGTNNFMKQIDKNHKYSQKIYDRYLKEHGNVSMIEPEGDFSVIWYYKDKKIYVTHISRAKISSTEEYYCDSVLDIKKYKSGCFPESIDADGFNSSFYDKTKDSLYNIFIGFDVNDLKSKGSDCPLIKDLRNHIIKYKLRKGFVDNK